MKDLKGKILNILQNNKGQIFTKREIARQIILKYPEDCEEKIKNSTQKNINLESQIMAEISPSDRDKKLIECGVVILNEEKPKKYYFPLEKDLKNIDVSNKVVCIDSDNVNKIKKNIYNNEHNLYPILIKYLKENNIIAKRIDEKKSSNKNEFGSNKWLYPDVVAVENLVKDWNKTTIECAKDYYIKKTKIYSYEVKKIINRSNVREAYFQAVSNSTWANFGYLVANEIHQNARKELEILNSLYGIGIIILKENLADSYIYMQAKEREYLDWNIINRLVEENSDFKNFIDTISDFYRNGRNDTLEKLFD